MSSRLPFDSTPHNPFAPRRKRFGELMVASRHLAMEELHELLAMQKMSPQKRLGYLCLQRRLAGASEVMDALVRQLPVAIPYSSRSS